ncbi:MAG TPA: cytochrome P450, partial [Mycobacterium sp.]|nr:cytochrome P450 [Mycobacterium sp.]
MSEPDDRMSATTITGSPQLYWDPFSPSLRDDPYALWKRLRDEAPVYHNDRYDFYVLSRFADVEAASLDPRTYLSSHGTSLEFMSPVPIPGGRIIYLDPPEHTRRRALISRAFTPRRMADVEPRVRQLCVRLLDAQRSADSFDVVQDFGAIVPPTVISTLLGVPEADHEHLRHVVDKVFHVDDGVGMMNPTSLGAVAEIDAYLLELIRERRAQPRDDLLSALAAAELTDEQGTHRLSETDAADFGKTMFIAGTETVARLIGWAAWVLHEHPAQRAELAADPGLIPNAIEELLRFEAPSPVQARWTSTSVSVHGVTIPANAKVVLLTGSAGRDERKYAQPDRFDIHRVFDRHVSFGVGNHFCL